MYKRRINGKITTRRNYCNRLCHTACGSGRGHQKLTRHRKKIKYNGSDLVFCRLNRNSIKRLVEIGKIERKEEKFTDLDTAFEYFPYHTSELEIYQLRKKFLPTIREYIKENNPRRFWYYDIEENQISKIRKTEKYLEVSGQWRRIQKDIISILNTGDTDMFDHWLQCLIRGRYLFIQQTVSHHKSLVSIYNALKKQKNNTIIELKTLKRLRNLINSTFDKTDWKIGELKSIYYKIADFQRHYRDTIGEEIKEYLRNRHEDLILSLPGHKEPPPPIEREFKVGNRKGIMQIPLPKKRRYSEYLDKLLTKQILRHHMLLKVR